MSPQTRYSCLNARHQTGEPGMPQELGGCLGPSGWRGLRRIYPSSSVVWGRHFHRAGTVRQAHSKNYLYYVHADKKHPFFMKERGSSFFPFLFVSKCLNRDCFIGLFWDFCFYLEESHKNEGFSLFRLSKR